MSLYLILFFLPFLALRININWIHGLHFLIRAPDVLAKHYAKVLFRWRCLLLQADSLQKNEIPHRIPTPQGRCVVVSSRQHVQELGKASADQLSLTTFFSDVGRFHYSLVASLS
jgi:hypothetical protein